MVEYYTDGKDTIVGYRTVVGVWVGDLRDREADWKLCHCLESRERIVLRIASLQNSDFGVWFLLNGYHFHISKSGTVHHLLSAFSHWNVSAMKAGIWCSDSCSVPRAMTGTWSLLCIIR